MQDHKRSVVVAVTGGSGVIIARRLLGVLLENDVHVHLCRSRSARLVIQDELPSEEGRDPLLAGLPSGNLEEWGDRDFRAPFASGSASITGMAVVPCSMTTLAGIATGVSSNLIRRSADVMLKERRPLVLVPREAPLSQIHLRNMLDAARAGAVIVPPVLTFYQDPGDGVAAQIDFVVSRVLDHLGIDNHLYRRWGE